MVFWESLEPYTSRVVDSISDKKTAGILVGSLSVGLITAYAYRSYCRIQRRRARLLPPDALPADAFDAVIVGAGPSGSTAAWFMNRGNVKVALLDKEHFPRDKYCGDAVCTPAIRILEEMGVMRQLEENDEAHFADAGGFVSPHGYCYIGASKQKIGEAAACAIKRIHLDDRLVKHAQTSGVHLKEGFEVIDAKFDQKERLWTVTAQGVIHLTFQLSFKID